MKERGSIAAPPASDPGDQNSAYLRTTFFERVAHELRGPGGVTLGALNEIERTLGAEADELRPLLGMARRGLARILRTADRLDRAAQLEGPRPEWRKTPVDLQNLVRDVVRETALLEARGAIRIDSSDDDTPCWIEADAAWIRVAIAELVANAIRFGRTRVSIETRAADGEAQVIITDDGPGFEGPSQSRFEPPRSGRGLGLSLPLVEDVARGYGGRLEFCDRKSEASGATGTRTCLGFPLSPRRGAISSGS